MCSKSKQISAFPCVSIAGVKEIDLFLLISHKISELILCPKIHAANERQKASSFPPSDSTRTDG
jgi:hypothetical protein